MILAPLSKNSKVFVLRKLWTLVNFVSEKCFLIFFITLLAYVYIDTDYHSLIQNYKKHVFIEIEATPKSWIFGLTFGGRYFYGKIQFRIQSENRSRIPY